MFIPNGRLSAVSHEGDKIQIQTEFALHPRPRVTTTVVLGGRVLHKEEQIWEAETETPESQEELESFLQKQHMAVHNKVEERLLEWEQPQVPQAARSDVRMPESPRGRHPAARTPGVLRLFIVSRSGELLAADDTGVPSPRNAEFFRAAAEFVEFFETAESQRFGQMLTRDRDGNFLLVRHFGKYWGAELAPGVDTDETLTLFLSALEA
jgi:hypothetical protein